MSAISDVERAVAARWDQFFLGASFPGGLHLAQLQLPDRTPPPMPYCVFRGGQAKPNRFSLDGTYRGHVQIEFEIYGTGVLGPAMSQIHQVFDWSTDGGTGTDRNVLPMPPGSYHQYTELGRDEEDLLTNLERNGQKVYRAIVRLVFHVRRLKG